MLRKPDSEVLLAFLNDVFGITIPNRVGTVHLVLQEELHRHARIKIHVGKTHVNAIGERLEACDVLEWTVQAIRGHESGKRPCSHPPGG